MTNGLVLFQNKDKWEGVIVNCDGYPSHLGKVLYHICKQIAQVDPDNTIEKMHTLIVKDHPAGWKSLHEEGNEHGMSSECYCHPKVGNPDEPDIKVYDWDQQPPVGEASWCYFLWDDVFNDHSGPYMKIKRGSSIMSAVIEILSADPDWNELEELLK